MSTRTHSWARHCVLRLQLLGRQTRGRGTWKRAPRIVPQWVKEDHGIYNPLVCHFSSRSRGVREPRHPRESCCSSKRYLTSNEIARTGSLNQIYRRHFRWFRKRSHFAENNLSHEPCLLLVIVSGSKKESANKSFIILTRYYIYVVQSEVHDLIFESS